MSRNKELICIRCPLGCMLTAEQNEKGEVTAVSGNTCPRGAEYARKELMAPTRMVTSTVAVRGGCEKRASVKTAADIPKGKIFECMEAIKKVRMDAPVAEGDVILSDVAGTGVAVIATKTVEKE